MDDESRKAFKSIWDKLVEIEREIKKTQEMVLNGKG